VSASSCRSRNALWWSLAAYIILSAAPLGAQTDPQWLEGRVASWYRTAERKAPGEWGIAVADPTGRLLWSANPDRPLMPA
jgi:hypothetical protein